METGNDRSAALVEITRPIPREDDLKVAFLGSIAELRSASEL
jgi:hypothetical protein